MMRVKRGGRQRGAGVNLCGEKPLPFFGEEISIGPKFFGPFPEINSIETNATRRLKGLFSAVEDQLREEQNDEVVAKKEERKKRLFTVKNGERMMMAFDGVFWFRKDNHKIDDKNLGTTTRATTLYRVLLCSCVCCEKSVAREVIRLPSRRPVRRRRRRRRFCASSRRRG